jgi:hypothetical protein
MRLLNTSTLRVESVPYDNIPQYAILSHTWGSDEVTFQQLQELNCSERPGEPNSTHPVRQGERFAKIRDSANLAHRSGYEFIWIDTCCIDKTSSAELSEAINSMFRYYQEAAICYAYLSDVPGASSQRTNSETSEAIDRETEAALRRSRWFTRGWTLQELIAPRDVHFFAMDWTMIGRKLDYRFARLVSQITEVDVPTLRGSSTLEELSVAWRMQWASTRTTTRVEDIAYCLLGIFGINMSPLYGEGPRAFIRLQEEILRRE